MRSWKSLSAKFQIVVALALLAGGVVSAAPLQRVSVTVSSGASPVAGQIRQVLPGYLMQELAEVSGGDFPALARLEIRIDEVYFSHDGGMPFGVTNDFGRMPDAMTGVARVTDAKGKLILQRRAFATSAPDAGGFGANNLVLRTDALMKALAYWVVREVAR